MKTLPRCFNLKRDGKPLNEVALSEPLQLDLDSSENFLILRAHLHCNASLRDIKDWWYGNDDPEITNLITQFYIADTLYDTHRSDMISLIQKAKSEAAAAEAKRKSKTKR